MEAKLKSQGCSVNMSGESSYNPLEFSNASSAF